MLESMGFGGGDTDILKNTLTAFEGKMHDAINAILLSTQHQGGGGGGDGGKN